MLADPTVGFIKEFLYLFTDPDVSFFFAPTSRVQYSDMYGNQCVCKLSDPDVGDRINIITTFTRLI